MRNSSVSVALGGGFLTLLVSLASFVSHEVSVYDAHGATPLTPQVEQADASFAVVMPQPPHVTAGGGKESIGYTSGICPLPVHTAWQVITFSSDADLEEQRVRPGVYRVYGASSAARDSIGRTSGTWTLRLLDLEGDTVAESEASKPLAPYEERSFEILSANLIVPREVTHVQGVSQYGEGDDKRRVVPVCAMLEPAEAQGSITIEAVRTSGSDPALDLVVASGVSDALRSVPADIRFIQSAATYGTSSREAHVAVAAFGKTSDGTLALLLFFVSILILLVAVHAQPKGVPDVSSTY